MGWGISFLEFHVCFFTRYVKLLIIVTAQDYYSCMPNVFFFFFYVIFFSHNRMWKCLSEDGEIVVVPSPAAVPCSPPQSPALTPELLAHFSPQPLRRNSPICPHCPTSALSQAGSFCKYAFPSQLTFTSCQAVGG